MSPNPPRHESPYPDGIDRRVSDLEGWRGTVDEWRRGVDSWRGTIEREGIVTAVAVIGTKMDQTHEDVASARTEIRDVKADVREVKTDLAAVKADVAAASHRRQGVAIFSKAGGAVIAVIGTLIAIVVALVGLIAGGGG